MSLLDQIKADQLAARKAKDTVATGLLTTLIGEASKISDEEHKKGVTTITDEKVIITMKKFLKNAEETLGHLKANYSDTTVVRREITILQGYLPVQMTEEALSGVIATYKAENPEANVGAIMSFLKANYAGLYDGKMASTLAK